MNGETAKLYANICQQKEKYGSESKCWYPSEHTTETMVKRWMFIPKKIYGIASGKRLHNYGNTQMFKFTYFQGVNQLSMAMFNSKALVYHSYGHIFYWQINPFNGPWLKNSNVWQITGW